MSVQIYLPHPLKAVNQLTVPVAVVGERKISRALSYRAVEHYAGGSIAVVRMLAEFYGEKVYAKLARLADAAGIEGADNKEKALAFIQAIEYEVIDGILLMRLGIADDSGERRLASRAGGSRYGKEVDGRLA